MCTYVSETVKSSLYKAIFDGLILVITHSLDIQTLLYIISIPEVEKKRKI